MFVRLSARSRTHRLCEDTRIRKVLPFLLDLRRRKCRRISRTASPARKLHTHTRERKRQSWLAKSVVVLVYSARLQIVSLRSRKAWWMKKDMKPRGMQKGWKMDANGGCRMQAFRRHVMNECIESWWTKEISLHPFVTWRRRPRFTVGMFQCWTGIPVEPGYQPGYQWEYVNTLSVIFYLLIILWLIPNWPGM
jgi:hypothetical protein